MAVRRSRAFRLRRQRQRKRLFTLSAGASLALAIATSFSLASFAGGDLADAAVSRARDFVDLIDQRSPGARTEANLTKTKGKRGALADEAPAVVAPVVPKTLADVLAPPEPTLVPVEADGPVGELALAAPPPAGAIIALPPGGGVTPPGGGGVTPPGGPGTKPPTTAPDSPPPPALPEPGTWMTMILGFGFAGWLLRRSRKEANTTVKALS